MLLFLSSKLISVGILKIINFETNLLNLYISCNIYKIPRVLFACLSCGGREKIKFHSVWQALTLLITAWYF